MADEGATTLAVQPIPGELSSHWAVYGRRCCVVHDPEDHTHADEYTSADQCCKNHDPKPVLLEFHADDLVALLPEAYRGLRLAAIKGPFDRLGRWYKVILEPKDGGD